MARLGIRAFGSLKQNRKKRKLIIEEAVFDKRKTYGTRKKPSLPKLKFMGDDK
jgi:hypothetical protein